MAGTAERPDGSVIIRSKVILEYVEESEREEYQQSFQLSAQILACCKLLNTEGRGVLYGENCLELGFQMVHQNAKWASHMHTYWMVVMLDAEYKLICENKKIGYCPRYVFAARFSNLRLVFWETKDEHVRSLC